MIGTIYESAVIISIIVLTRSAGWGELRVASWEVPRKGLRVEIQQTQLLVLTLTSLTVWISFLGLP